MSMQSEQHAEDIHSLETIIHTQGMRIEELLMENLKLRAEVKDLRSKLFDASWAEEYARGEFEKHHSYDGWKK